MRRWLVLMLTLPALVPFSGCSWYEAFSNRFAPNLKIPPADRVRAEQLEAEQPD